MKNQKIASSEVSVTLYNRMRKAYDAKFSETTFEEFQKKVSPEEFASTKGVGAKTIKESKKFLDW